MWDEIFKCPHHLRSSGDQTMTSANTDVRATAEEQADNEIIACEACGYQWNTQSEMKRVTCPNCQHKTKRNVVELRRTERGKWTCDGASSIEEMAGLHEQKATFLRELDENGWELDGSVRDDYAKIRYTPMGGDDDGN